jgi:hypothetical protein
MVLASREAAGGAPFSPPAEAAHARAINQQGMAID